MVSRRDKDILRRLASKVREIAEHSDMHDLKRRWYDHNALKQGKPMVLCFPEGAWQEMLPETSIECEDPLLRSWELELRMKIYSFENIRDDNTVEPWFNMSWYVTDNGYGVNIHYNHGENRGSYVWDPPLKDLSKDLDKLHFRQLNVDREKTIRHMDLASAIFGDLLLPRLHTNGYWWTMGITWEAIKLVGLENLMYLMVDEPENVHRLIHWLMEEHLHYIGWFEQEGLLLLNNENGYTGSGGVAYTTELPQPDYREGQPVRLKDLWGFAESQETVGISPGMFGEFILPYQIPLLEKFGLNCYGCCEPVHERWKFIKKIPNLRRISVSPWCNQALMAEYLGPNYIFSRKPNPSMVCSSFSEEEIRKDIRQTLDVTKGCITEIILKDTHTVMYQPWRLTRWVQIAKEEVEKYK